MYVNLHTHTEFSFLDGAAKAVDVVRKARDLEQPAIALTEHGHIASVPVLLKTAKEFDIKPIIGMEAYICADRHDKVCGFSAEKRPYHHITLIALNKEGYLNLVAMTAESYRTGFYYRPRIDFDLLCDHNSGVAVLSGCIGSELAYDFFDLTKGKPESLIELYASTFNDRYFLEISDNNASSQSDTYKMQTSYSKYLSDVADRLNGGRIVFTGDSHYLDHSHHGFHDCVLAVGAGTWVGDEKRKLKFDGEYHVKSYDEVFSVCSYQYHKKAIKNTLVVADMVEDYGLLSSTFYIPQVVSKPEIVLDSKVRSLTSSRYKTMSEAVLSRVDEELWVICKKGFASYFLMLAEVCEWARSQDIVLGYGRGSAAGSIVSYILGITNIDPLKYSLLFSRFLNMERDDLPDIDIDIEDKRRDEVIQYLRDRFGNDRVIQIGSYGSVGTKTAIRDMGRSLHVPISVVNSICSAVPDVPDIKLEDIENTREMRRALSDDNIPDGFWDKCKLIEGNVRQFAVHAAGVAILPESAVGLIPIYRKSGKGSDITQYDMKGMAAFGILKMDFLGLRTLRVVSDACRMSGIRREDIPLDDVATFNLVSSGDVAGVFQIEGDGYKSFMKELKPDNFEMLIDAMALYRPSTMDNGDLNRYLARRHNMQTIEFFRPEFESIMADTLGICLYQEQAMQVAQVIAGYSSHEADTLRRIFGKKLKHKIPEEKIKFMCQAVENGHTESSAESIFDYIATFAGYGFNKAHATSYAFLCYWTAYLSANYPVAFYVATLNSLITDTDRIREYLMHIKERGIAIVPPSINESNIQFSMSGEEIVYGLHSVKYVGEKASNVILQERTVNGRFKDVKDFRSRVSKQSANSKVLEMLINVGAFDKIAANRSVYTYEEKLQFEYEGLGMYVSGHPLDQYVQFGQSMPVSKITPEHNDQSIQLHIYTVNIHKHTTKTKKAMAFMTAADHKDDAVDIVLFPNIWNKYKNDLQDSGQILELVGKVNYKRGTKSIIAQHIKIFA